MNKHVKVKKHPIVEIFGPTIQGEGSVLGRRTMFIRFGGCDYRCTKCDSLHAVLPELVKQNSRYLTPIQIAEELIEKVGLHDCKMVTFSGGNPCMHNLSDLVSLFNGANIDIAVETQGTIWQDWLHDCEWITVSPKGPGMGEKFELDKFQVFVDQLEMHSGFSVKIVIMDQRDIEFAKMIDERFPDISRSGRMYLSLGNPYPPDPTVEKGSRFNTEIFRSLLLDSYKLMTEELLQENVLPHAIITPQFHVLLWGNKQGV